ncbi:putative RNA methyltransferase [Geobacter sp. OR-1]|uniref:23S rRNA (uracil(1939)-C(5))-methyltransferase RlmD n=1 Tax=Geobacter sp. OR-1 TaxID=1266765 RepID=UPI0005435502|nr:23S rRNA (uracil(1939)-C(5))-methyltransferase RlmD [Geobacter sp. OR-1]GAM11559.1 putative RNA methyltransferase [Geobacter sp. OR-1]
MKFIEVEIEKVAFGGAGFGHVDGKACFVPFATPGDRVRAKVIKEKKSYLEAELVDLVAASPTRIDPLCPVFGTCGGCSLQQISYQQQLSVKEEMFAEQLWRFAKVDRSVISPIQPAVNPWNYRTRVQVKLYWRDNSLLMGFFRGGTHFVVPFPGSCAISAPVVNNVITELGHAVAASPEPDMIPQIDIASGDDGETIIIIHYIGNRPDVMSGYFSGSCRESIPSVDGFWLQHGRKSTLKWIAGIERLSYKISSLHGTNLRLSFSKGGFSQVNYAQNQNLVRIACEMSGLTGKERVLDLFCGNGNLTLPLALLSTETVGIEEYAPSIQDARENAAANGICNVSFTCSDAEAGVAGLVKAGEVFDVVVLDPPRTGAAEIMRFIPQLKPARVVYISCDPVTLARDIAILKKLDYSVVRSVPVDMFPQTSHIESVSLLEQG